MCQLMVIKIIISQSNTYFLSLEVTDVSNMFVYVLVWINAGHQIYRPSYKERCEISLSDLHLCELK